MSTVAENTRRWLTLGAACRMLEVNEATLRQWADDGRVRVFRTPGGHRRFLRSDVEAMAERGAQAAEAGNPEGETPTLRRIRRRLKRGDVAQQPWYATIDAEGRDRLRLFGRRLLTLFAGAGADRRRRSDLLAEARGVGEEYGREMARSGLPLARAVEAFVFFREAMFDAASMTQIKGLSKALDSVLLGITGGYTPPTERTG